jgi:hypothetical protein
MYKSSLIFVVVRTVLRAAKQSNVSRQKRAFTRPVFPGGSSSRTPSSVQVYSTVVGSFGEDVPVYVVHDIF